MIVYWLQRDLDEEGMEILWTPKRAHYKEFSQTELLQSNSFMQQLRKDKSISNVTISTEFSESIGALGVDEVKDGKTPDGESYQWSKTHRAGADRKR